MTFLTAVLLGLVQGVTEFLPVSSSGHLALLQNLFHIEGADMEFDVLLHLGTLAAVLLAYRRDITQILRGGLGLVGLGPERGKTTHQNADGRKLAVFIAAGTVPLVLALPLQGVVDKIFGNSTLISIMLLLSGTVLYLSDRFAAGFHGIREASVWQAFLVGVGQTLAVIPGVSRAGLTMSCGMFCGFQRSFAVRFSFLLSVPAVLGATVLSLIHAVQDGIQVALLPMYLCGMLTAAVSGYFSIRLLRYLAEKSNFGGFAYYCWGAGMVSLVLSLVS